MLSACGFRRCQCGAGDEARRFLSGTVCVWGEVMRVEFAGGVPRDAGTRGGAVARFDFDLRWAVGIVISEIDLQGSAVLDDEVASVCWMEVVVVMG